MARTKSFDPIIALEKARLCFQSGGYHGTNLEALSFAMQISRSSLYNVWPDKQTLYRDALSACANQVLSETKQLTTAIKHQVPDLIKAFLINTVCCDDNKGWFLVNAAVELAGNNEEITAICKGSFDSSISYLTNLLAKGQSDASIRRDIQALDLANIVQNQIAGIHFAKKINTPKPILMSMVESLISLISV
jgi:TetR/AcrR family transcriptional repressor of nem operon